MSNFRFESGLPSSRIPPVRMRTCVRREGPEAEIHRERSEERPPYEQLLREIEATSYVAVGRKYGVSDNAIRKWVRAYEREREPPG